MQNVEDILDLWPSMADLGRDLDLPYSTVAAWKQRGSIPPQHWRGIIRASQARGRRLTSDMLIEAHSPVDAAEPLHGVAEEGVPYVLDHATALGEGDGHFSRWKSARRSHFATMDEVNDHVRALREEWDRR